MPDEPDIDPATGLLNRQAFLREARQAQQNLPARARRGCLLIIRFPLLLTLEQLQGEAALNEVLKHLLAIVETRLRSRDVLGRISKNTLCLLLKQCREADAIVVADQYVVLLRDVIFEISGKPRSLDFRYRIVPLDPSGNPGRRGISRVVQASSLPGVTLIKEPQDSPDRVDQSTSKIVSLGDLRQRTEPEQAELGRVIRLPSSSCSSATQGVSWRLRPGMLISRKSLVCCFRLQAIGIREAPELLQESAVFASVLDALSVEARNKRPRVQSQLILPVQAGQIDADFADWVSKRCEIKRIAPSDICLSLSFESVSFDLRRIAPRLRVLNRRGLRLMIEGMDSVAQLKSLFKLARFDYLHISGRVFNDSKSQLPIRQNLELLINFANTQHCEICAGGIDTPVLVEHAKSLGVEIGFGRACGKSVPFSNQLQHRAPG